MRHHVEVSTALSDAREEVCIAVFASIMRAHQALHRLGSKVAGDFGLHIADLNVIDMLGRLGPLSMGGLSRATFISPSNTTRTVKKLESQRYVTRKRSAESGRVVTAALTKTGERMFKKCYPRVLDAADNHFRKNLSATEYETLAKLLYKLAP